jgi:tetrapyrrole methylase family protein/MazG family protein
VQSLILLDDLLNLWATSMSERFTKLVDLMAALRAQNGCPWDRKQTHESLKPYLLEEAYEVIETIDLRDEQKLREELGDVLLQVLFHSQIAAEAGSFTVEDVIETLATKLIHRHPHVFRTGEQAGQASNSEQVLAQWEDIKRAEREAAGNTQSALDGVPKTLPALLRAYQIRARAARVGFDWPQSDAGLEQVLAKITEEIGELREALILNQARQARIESESNNRPDTREEIENELGDLLFSLVNLARFLKANPEDALRRATNRFIDRFHLVEAQALGKGRLLTEMTLPEMDELWNEAKRQLRRSQLDTTPHVGDRIL